MNKKKMAPYIALLIVLIVSILFAVYKRVDGFELGTVSVTKDTKVTELVTMLDKLVKQNKAIKRKLDAAEEFDDVTLTQAKLTELGLQFSVGDNGELTVDRPISKTLSQQVGKELTEQEAFLEKIDASIKSGEIKLTMTLQESDTARKESNPPNYELFSTIYNAILKVSNAREAYVNSMVKGSDVNTKEVAGVDATELYGAVGGVTQALKASSVGVGFLEEERAKAPETTNAMTKEVEDRIAKNIATQLKDSVLIQRATHNPMGDSSCSYASADSDAVQQGQEYRPGKPAPDMSEYIRKDSIPCWNCSLP